MRKGTVSLGTVQRKKRLPHKGTYCALKKGNILSQKRANRRISPSISTKKGVILLVTSPRQLASGKRQTLQGERISRSPDAELPAREATQSHEPLCNSLANLHPKAGFKAKLNCNTPLPEYVLSCVFRFFDRIFRFTSCICFVL